MKPWLVDYLACPVSGDPLILREAALQDGEIVSGRLVSSAGREYPITGGVPDLSLAPVSADEKQTVEAFGRQWDSFGCCDGYMSSQELFFSFFPTLRPADVAGKGVLDAGCGNGRWLRRLAELGARHVIGLDYSTAVFNSWKNVRNLPNVSVVRGSILQPPLRRANLDLVVSMGVVHHLDDPEQGMRRLANLLAPEGRLAVWLYAHEGNELYLRLVSPLRRWGPRLPRPALLFLSSALAAPCWLHAHTFNRWLGWRADGAPRLPLAEYFALLARLRWLDVVNIVYDQLTPQLARYYRRRELETLIENAGLQLVGCERPRGNSWSVLARPAAPSDESIIDKAA
jgi:SAM-dependent methyltransferase